MQVYNKWLTTGTVPQMLSKPEYLVDTEGQSAIGKSGTNRYILLLSTYRKAAEPIMTLMASLLFLSSLFSLHLLQGVLYYLLKEV